MLIDQMHNQFRNVYTEEYVKVLISQIRSRKASMNYVNQTNLSLILFKCAIVSLCCWTLAFNEKSFLYEPKYILTHVDKSTQTVSNWNIVKAPYVLNYVHDLMVQHDKSTDNDL